MSISLTSQQLKTLSSAFIFKNVDEIMIEQLAADPRCTLEAYPRGAVIFDETHFRRSLGIVLSGEILVEKTTKLSMSRLFPGDSFGAAAMFHDRSRYVSLLTAKKPTEVLYLPQEVIIWAMERNFAITENYIAYLSDRIWFLSSRISALTAGTAEQKLAVYLLEQGDVESSMTDLSMRLNLGRASLYRAAETLEELGAIAREGKRVKVLERETLIGIVKKIRNCE